MARHEAVAGQEVLLRSWDEIKKELSVYPRGLLTEILLGLGGIRPENTVTLEATGLQGYGGQMKALKNDLALWREHGYRTWLLSGGSSRGRRLEESLKELGERAVF